MCYGVNLENSNGQTFLQDWCEVLLEGGGSRLPRYFIFLLCSDSFGMWTFVIFGMFQGVSQVAIFCEFCTVIVKTVRYFLMLSTNNFY